MTVSMPNVRVFSRQCDRVGFEKCEEA